METRNYSKIFKFASVFMLAVIVLWAYLPALIMMMGYTFMSVSAIIIGFPFVRIKGYSSWINWFLFLSGVTGIIGWLEYYLELSSGGIGVVISGMFMIPFCIAILVTAGKTNINLKAEDM